MSQNVLKNKFVLQSIIVRKIVDVGGETVLLSDSESNNIYITILIRIYMKKRSIVCVFVALLLLVSLGIVFASRSEVKNSFNVEGQVFEIPKISSVKIDSKIGYSRRNLMATSFRSEKKYEVIVSIRNPQDIEDWSEKLEAMREREIKGLKEKMREHTIKKIGGERGNVGYKFNSFNGYSATLTEGEMDRLVSSGLVKEVNKNRKVRAFLQDSTQIINASETQNLEVEGENLSGKGKTVCVIDTGVDYTHPDLGGCTTEEFLNGNCGKVVGGYDFVNKDNDPLDNHGHGTHCSGIVGANGGIKGVAPDTKIYAIKALDSNGDGSTSNVAAGIENCTNASEEYNISVISMSLGGGQYDDYCYEQSTTAAINEAVAKNISVVISTGNTGDGFNDPVAGISFPACIPNATRVTAMDKDDTYASYAFRNSNFTDILSAPGTNINSTWNNGGYVGDSGTSMSAPHVAGTIAIVNQYLEISNKSKNSSEIEQLLNGTGKSIYDSESGINYSRINVLNSILSMDTENPNIALKSPSANLTSGSTSQNFSCEFSDNLELENGSIHVWNKTAKINKTSFVLEGSEDTLQIEINNLSDGGYNWTCSGYDAAGNYFISENRSLNIDLKAPSLEYGDNSYREENYSRDWIFINVSANDSSLDSIGVNLYLFNQTGGEFITINSSLNDSFQGQTFNFNRNFTNLESGRYVVNSSANDSVGNKNSSSLQIWLDTSLPEIDFEIVPRIVSPGKNISINFSGFDSSPGLDSIWMEVEYPSGVLATFEENKTIEANESGNYSVSFFANDSFGNLASRESDFFAYNSTIFNSSIETNFEGNKTVRAYFPGSKNIINSTISTNKNISLSLPKYIYDIEYRLEGKSSVFLRSVNISLEGRNITIQNTSSGEYLKTVAVNTGINFSNSTLSIYYNDATFENENYSGVYKCGEWNFSSKNCLGGWRSFENFTQNKSENYFSIHANTYSAFSLKQEIYCGDGVCSDNESCSSCPGDCGQCDDGDDGSGGSSSSTIGYTSVFTNPARINESGLRKGYTNEFTTGEIKFEYGGKNYSLEIINIDSPLELRDLNNESKYILEGGTKKMGLDPENKISIKVNEIGPRANLTIRIEPIKKEKGAEENGGYRDRVDREIEVGIWNENGSEKEKEEKDKKTKIQKIEENTYRAVFIYFPALVILAILIISFLVWKRYRKEKFKKLQKKIKSIRKKFLYG